MDIPRILCSVSEHRKIFPTNLSLDLNLTIGLKQILTSSKKSDKGTRVIL